MQIFVISSATEVKLKFGQTYEHNITRRMAVINICKLILMYVCGSWFRQKCICYTLSDAVQHVYEFTRWRSGYVFRFGDFHFCQRLRPRPVCSPWWLIRIRISFGLKFIFAELIVFSSERAFWVFFQTTTKGKKHKQSQDPETLGKVHFKTRNDKTTKETIYSRNICELKENPRRFVYTQKNNSTLTYAGRVELWKSVKWQNAWKCLEIWNHTLFFSEIRINGE